MNSLKEFREKVGLKQYEAASKLGITKDYLCMLENKKRTPSNKLIAQMALLYKKSPEDIFLATFRT